MLTDVIAVEASDRGTHLIVIIVFIYEGTYRASEVEEPQVWISSALASKLLQVSLVVIYNWSKDGILRAYRIGNRVRFRRSEIEQILLNSNRKASI